MLPQAVAARGSELRAAIQDAQGNLDGAQQHLQQAAASALQHTAALSADDLCSSEAVRGRLAELAAAKSLAAVAGMILDWCSTTPHVHTCLSCFARCSTHIGRSKKGCRPPRIVLLYMQKGTAAYA